MIHKDRRVVKPKHKQTKQNKVDRVNSHESSSVSLKIFEKVLGCKIQEFTSFKNNLLTCKVINERSLNQSWMDIDDLIDCQ